MQMADLQSLVLSGIYGQFDSIRSTFTFRGLIRTQTADLQDPSINAVVFTDGNVTNGEGKSEQVDDLVSCQHQDANKED